MAEKIKEIVFDFFFFELKRETEHKTEKEREKAEGNE